MHGFVEEGNHLIRGGCSPIGMKKQFPTLIDEQAQTLETMIVSGGQIGVQIELQVENLVKATKAAFADVTQ
ncbi:hypothetical protein EDM52_19095 [Brevibacillus invocatus]|uniref:Uncharacterized protein n=1 Tax=Brevibacillus invocatus TaxID=173959 RepID=A0A3M8C140_9BACL|nr:hypothetical protein EDM52_19095 [Brevibacillus invocatus]